MSHFLFYFFQIRQESMCVCATINQRDLQNIDRSSQTFPAGSITEESQGGRPKLAEQENLYTRTIVCRLRRRKMKLKPLSSHRIRRLRTHAQLASLFLIHSHKTRATIRQSARGVGALLLQEILSRGRGELRKPSIMFSTALLRN